MSKKSKFNRRDFLGTGLSVIPAWYFPVFQMMSSRAEAMTDIINPSYTLGHIHLSGGCGIHKYLGSALAAGITDSRAKIHGVFENLSLAGATTTIGKNNIPVIAPAVDADATQGSHFLRGFLPHLTPAELGDCQFTNLISRSDDDNTAGAQYALMPPLAHAGIRGILTSALGSEANPAGNGVGLFTEGSAKKITVSRPRNVFDGVKFSKVFGNLPKGLHFKMVEHINKLTGKQRANMEAKIGQKVDLAYAGLNGRVDPPIAPAALNPTEGVTGQKFGLTLTPVTDDNLRDTRDSNTRTATMVKACLSGAAAGFAMRFGGYDYHNDPLSDTAEKDFDAGEVAGKICGSFAASGKNLLLFISTDGGNRGNTSFTTSSENSTALFVGDRARLNGGIVIAVSATAPEFKPVVGSFATDLQVQENSPLSSDSLTAALVFNTYMKLIGQEGRVPAVLEASKLTRSQQGEILSAFGGSLFT